MRLAIMETTCVQILKDKQLSNRLFDLKPHGGVASVVELLATVCGNCERVLCTHMGVLA
jgi:hypothetical protein